MALAAGFHYDGMSIEVQYGRAFLEMFQQFLLTLEHSITQTTAKLFDSAVNRLMILQFSCCAETLWTVATDVRLHTFMSTYMCLNVTTTAELLLTNVTREPSAFIMRRQQMCLELVTPSEMIRTVST